MSLTHYGWNPRLASTFAPHRDDGFEPARIIRADRDLYVVQTEAGAARAAVSGRLRQQARHAADFPAVGDWVAVRVEPTSGRATIHATLPRTTCFSRKVAGEVTEEQVLAANVDLIFVVCGLDGEFNPRRLERFVAAAWESGARVAVVLNKADTCADLESRLAEAAAVAPGAPVLPVSAVTRAGLEAVVGQLAAGVTVALLGASGVGKSTLANALLGEERQSTGAVRAHDGRGRHTTTARELMPLPGGAVLLDTPGMRELQLWSATGELGGFPEIETLAAHCRFRDCRHELEPGCAVRAAHAAGTLDDARLEGWRKLQREAEAFAARHDRRLALERKARWRGIGKQLRNRPDKREI